MAALDILAGLADGLRASLDPLLAAKPLTPVLLLACGDEQAEVRQSGFALLGDLARGCPAHVMDKFAELVGLGLASLEAPMLLEQNMASCNNATWSVGELVVKVRGGVLLVCLTWTSAEAQGCRIRNQSRLCH
jgi:transportin-1